MFNDILNDEVTLLKKNGSKYESIKANVQPEKIFIMDETIPIEEGDKIQRELSNGLIESYIVLDRGFYNVDMGRMSPHYQCKVKKETAISSETQRSNKKIYNINGENSRVNINSTDNSTNIVNVSSDNLFEELRNMIKENIDKNNEILDAIDEMEKNQNNKESFMVSYQKFISLISDHISLISPFIPALSQFFV
ncbi:hypothetical protein SAMN05192551_103255 [Tindallia magadiensis]|uniref:Uncharacterized protein n=1 Tax=Tindallia magadiensis TaxID=69895 RepID=A0A1I3DDJ5_9FIRM|nr:hypothetical protein [Tindallia magadiensis]SFH84804.1 hypothetical protein SAMN05192551_103255 [Tindallia magadiensis]